MTLAPVAALLLTAADGAVKHHGFWYGVGKHLHHFAEVMKGFGVWGLAGLSLFDAALLPTVPIDGVLAGYVSADPGRFWLYAFAAAIASTVGSLLPYYVGRLGGELVLLKKINRQRYERLRDRFERQEFLAILIPAMGPPPTPIKLFEFAAGVFEMRVLPYFCAMFLGKLIQFLAVAGLTARYGPQAMHLALAGVRGHARLILTVIGLLTLFVAIWVVRRIFARRNTERFPIEDGDLLPVVTDGPSAHTIVEE